MKAENKLNFHLIYSHLYLNIRITQVCTPLHRALLGLDI